VLPFFEIAVSDEPGRIRLGRSLKEVHCLYLR
jgi:hypothetical protein